ncbi:hypothetical protein QJQ45_021661 [Haematococcus lacustris]|nr:hypothetical protein QJQ45_021661 [Haematococcus lacustris]
MELRETFLSLAAPPYSVQEQAGKYCFRLELSALWAWQQVQAASKASASEEERCNAQQLCSLLLTDPEMLDVLLALHDIRAAQLGLSFPLLLTRQGRPGDTGNKWDVPTTRLSKFCLESVQIGETGNPSPDHVNSHVWPSLCCITDILLAVVQSIALQPQPAGPAHAPTTSMKRSPAARSNSSCQLPPGFVRCSAGLNLSLRLATGQAVQARQQVSAHQAAMDRLHPVLGPWLRGQCVAHSLLLAAGHPQWEAQRSEAVCNLVMLVETLARDTELRRYTGEDIKPVSNITGSAIMQFGERLRNIKNSPMTTGWPGPLPTASTHCSGNGSRQGSGSTGAELDLRVVNSYAHICHALSSLVHQQPQPLERMRLASTVTLGRGELAISRCIDSIGVATTLLSREWFALNRLGFIPYKFPKASCSDSSPDSAAPGASGACPSCHKPSCRQDCLGALLPVMFPVLHRAVTVTAGSAVLLRFTLWATLHQPPDKRWISAVHACFLQLNRLGNLSCHLLTCLDNNLVLGGQQGQALRRLDLMALTASTYSQVTYQKLVEPQALKMLVPNLAWPKHPAMPTFMDLGSSGSWGLVSSRSWDSILERWAEQGAAGRQSMQVCLEVVRATELLLQSLECVCSVWAYILTVVSPSQQEAIRKEDRSDSEEWCLVAMRMLVLSVQLLQDTAVVGPAGLTAKPASWLPPGQQLIRGWCARLASRVCQVADMTKLLTSPTSGFNISRGGVCLGALVQHDPMESDAEDALALLIVTLGLAVPLITVLKLVDDADDEVAEALDELWQLLSQVPAHQVQGWRATVQGTASEDLLQQALAAADLKLTLPHLTAVAPKGKVATAVPVQPLPLVGSAAPGSALVRLLRFAGWGVLGPGSEDAGCVAAWPLRGAWLPQSPGSPTAINSRAWNPISLPANRSKRSKAEQAAEPVQPTKGKSRAAQLRPLGTAARLLIAMQGGYCVADMGHDKTLQLGLQPPLHKLLLVEAKDPVQGPGDPVQGPTDKTLLGILTALCARTLLGFLQTLFLVLQTLFGLFPTLAEMREALERLAAPPYTDQEKPVKAASKSSATAEDIYKAQGLCSLLLTDPEALDILLALHDIRAAQLMLPFSPKATKPRRAAVPCSKWEVPAVRMFRFCRDSLLARGTIEVDAEFVMTAAWPSLCRITDILVAVVQSIPLRLPPTLLQDQTASQPPLSDAAAQASPPVQPTSPCRLAPGFVRCSAGLNFSLCLAAAYVLEARMVDHAHLAAMDRLHPVLGPWLRGQCVAHSLLLAAGHPQWEAQRSEAVCNLLTLVRTLALDVDKWDYTGEDICEPVSCKGPGQAKRLLNSLLSSPMTTGWPGPLPAAQVAEQLLTQVSKSSGMGGKGNQNGSRRTKSSKGSASGSRQIGGSTGAPLDLRVVNSYAHICHALSSLVLQQPQPLERMKLFSATTPGQGTPTPGHCIECLFVVRAMMLREHRIGRNLKALPFTSSATGSYPGSSTSTRPRRPCNCCLTPGCQGDCSDALLPAVLPMLHRAVTVASGSAVLLRLLLWVATQQAPDADCIEGIHECETQLSDLTARCCKLLGNMHRHQLARCLSSPQASSVASIHPHPPPAAALRLALQRLSLDAMFSTAYSYTTMLLVEEPDALTDSVPELAWPKQPVLHMMLGMRSRPREGVEFGAMKFFEGMLDEGLAVGRRGPQAALGVLRSTEAMVQAFEVNLAVRVYRLENGIYMDHDSDVEYVSDCDDDSCKTEDEDDEMDDDCGSGGGGKAAAWCLLPLRLLVLSTQLLQDPAVVGPAGLAAKPAAWLPPGQQLIKDWCERLDEAAADFAERMSLQYHPKAGLALSRAVFILPALVQHPPMEPDAEQALASLMLTLGLAIPLLMVLRLKGTSRKRSPKLRAALKQLKELLSQVPAHQVQGWMDILADSEAASLLFDVLVDAAHDLCVPHLAAAEIREEGEAAEGGAEVSCDEARQAQQSLVELMACLGLCLNCTDHHD